MKGKNATIVFLTFVIIILFNFINNMYLKNTLATDLFTNQVNESNNAAVDLDLNIDVDKKSAAEGEIVTYIFTVKNIGTSIIKNISINDITIPDIEIIKSADDNGKEELYPGKAFTFTSKYAILSSNNEDYFINEATAKGEKDDKIIESQNRYAEVLVNKNKASLTVKKSVNRAKAIIGDVLEYTIVVTNTGNTPLNNIAIVDNQKSGPIILANNGSVESLNPNESIIFLGNYIINQIDIEDNKIINVANVTAISNTGEALNVTSNEAVTTIINSSLKLKVTVSNDVPMPGEKVTYTFLVTNIGINAIKDIKINCDKINISRLNPKSIASLAQGQNATFTVDFVVPQDVLANDTIENKTVVSGKDAKGNLVTSDIVSTICTISSNDEIKPSMTVTKIIDKENPFDGDFVKYTITLVNTGNVPVKNVVVEDKQLVFKKTIDKIDIGQTIEIEVNKLVIEDPGETFMSTVEVSSDNLEKITADASYTVAYENNTQEVSPVVISPVEALPTAGEKVMTIIVSFLERLVNLFK